jgi:hypothetical protein
MEQEEKGDMKKKGTRRKKILQGVYSCKQLQHKQTHAKKWGGYSMVATQYRDPIALRL